jgi:hypothetical protein
VKVVKLVRGLAREAKPLEFGSGEKFPLAQIAPPDGARFFPDLRFSSKTGPGDRLEIMNLHNDSFRGSPCRAEL